MKTIFVSKNKKGEIKMKQKKGSCTNKGFTLIELLVIVLIIGVLVASAVTQYKKGVLRAKFSTIMPTAKTLYDGQEVFYMTRNYYTSDFSNLELPTDKTIIGDTANINGNIYTIGNNDRHIYIKATKEGLNNNYIMYQSNSKYFPNEIHCEAKTDNQLANWLCKDALQGEKLERSLSEGYTDYVIRGSGNGYFPIDWVNIELGGRDFAHKITLSSGDTCTGTEEEGCSLLILKDSECEGNASLSCEGLTANNSICIANGSQACKLSTFNNGSICKGNDSGGCASSAFRDSTCIADGYGSCGVFDSGVSSRESYFHYNNSICIGNGINTCKLNTYENNSRCEGNSPTSCQGSIFKSGSICHANVEGACGNYYNSYNGEIYETTYEDDACCSGQYCPDYAPKCS